MSLLEVIRQVHAIYDNMGSLEHPERCCISILARNELYEQLEIELRGDVTIQTKRGMFILPANGARANAWVCSLCQNTVYDNPLDYPGEFDPELTERDEYNNDLSFPISFFIGQDEDGVELTLHMICAEYLGLFNNLKSVEA